MSTAVWYANNREKSAKQCAAYRKTHRAEVSTYKAKWYRDNYERVRAHMDAYHDAHREERNAYARKHGREWRKKHPEYHREYYQKNAMRINEQQRRRRHAALDSLKK